MSTTNVIQFPTNDASRTTDSLYREKQELEYLRLTNRIDTAGWERLTVLNELLQVRAAQQRLAAA